MDINVQRSQICQVWLNGKQIERPGIYLAAPLLKPFCLQGNEKFVAKDNIGALKLYTESVICAPEVGPELSLAFGNRFDFKVLILGIFNPIVWTWSQIWNLSQFCSQVPDLHPFSDMSR